MICFCLLSLKNEDLTLQFSGNDKIRRLAMKTEAMTNAIFLFRIALFVMIFSFPTVIHY
jgi:hypothetical protein